MEYTKQVSKERKSVYIIAEMACSHEGNPDIACKIIDGAGQAGADAIQFQIWSLKDMVVPDHPDIEKLRQLEMTTDDWRRVFNYTKRNYPNMDVIACIYEKHSLEFCEDLGVDAYKLHTSDLSNPILVKCVSKTGRRIDLSVGASTIEEMYAAIEWIKDKSDCNIWLMYGYQDFPTNTSDVHLRFMAKLSSLFEIPVGYQDHCDAESQNSFWVPAAAVGMGIQIIEKHITHDRSLKGVDHEAALNPDEFSEFVGMIRTLEGAMGISVPKPFSEAEMKYRVYSKKSLVAAKDIRQGERIERDDLTFMRAKQLGFPPDQDWRFVGKMATRNIAQYQLLDEKDVS